MSTRNPTGRYAVAVRVGDDLFQVFGLRRSRQGQIYFEWPGREPEEWDPHTSYHSSGELHQKSFGTTYGIIQRQRPDALFTGSGQCIQTPLVSGEAEALNLICDVADYERVFEIADHQLNKRLGNNPTHISVDATEAGRTPETILALSPRIIKQEAVSTDAVPWLWLTLFDIPQLERVESQGEAEVRKAEELERARTVIQNLKRAPASVRRRHGGVALRRPSPRATPRSPGARRGHSLI